VLSAGRDRGPHRGRIFPDVTYPGPVLTPDDDWAAFNGSQLWILPFLIMSGRSADEK
jgi:hypothetical protein